MIYKHLNGGMIRIGINYYFDDGIYRIIFCFPTLIIDKTYSRYRRDYYIGWFNIAVGCEYRKRVGIKRFICRGFYRFLFPTRPM